MNKRGMVFTLPMVILIVAVVALFAGAGIQSGLSGFIGTVTGGELSIGSTPDETLSVGGEDVPFTASGDISTTRTATLSLVRANLKGTSVVSPSTYWYLNDVYKEVDGGAAPSVTMAYGDTYTYLTSNGTSTGVEYYGETGSGVAGVVASETKQVELWYGDTSPSIKIFSDDDGNLISGTNPEPLSASDDVVLEGSIKAGADMLFGGACDGNMLICFDYNVTEYDEVSEVAYNRETTIPKHLLSVAETCWEIPTTRNNQRTDFDIRLDVASAAAVDGTQNITVYFVDKDWYRHTETLDIECGTNNNANTQLGLSDQTQTIWIS